MKLLTKVRIPEESLTISNVTQVFLKDEYATDVYLVFFDQTE